MQDKLAALEGKIPVAHYTIPIENKKVAIAFSVFCIITMISNGWIIFQGFSSILEILSGTIYIFNILAVLLGVYGIVVDFLMVV